MTWLHPLLLWLLLVPALGWLADFRARRRTGATDHPRIRRAEAGPAGLQFAADARRDPGRIRRRWRLWLGLALALAALARPQWGETEQPVFDQAREIVIALDLSRSMLAEDVRPNRLERARLLVASLLEHLEGERVGLVVFAGTAFLQSPLSADYEILREFLPALGPDHLPAGGTNYHALLTAALDAFGPAGDADRFLIILSDGEAQEDNWRPLVPRLNERGIRVLGLGLGTAAGGMLPDGAGSFIKDERGAVVLSRLEPATLQELARLTNGAYREASAWVDLAGLLRTTVEAGRAGEFAEAARVRRIDRFQWLLTPAVLLLAWSLWREMPVPVRPRPLRLPAGATPVLVALGLAFAWPTPVHAEDDPAAALAATVARLAGQPRLSAPDHADVAERTLTYAGDLTAAGEQPHPGAIRDALAAVTAGSRLAPQARNWARLREQLEAYLPDEPPPEPESDESSPPEDQPQDESSDESNEAPDGEPSEGEGEKGDSSESSDPSDGERESDANESESGEGDESDADTPPPAGAEAFGDMSSEATDPAEPPPAQDAPTQTVGGQPDRSPPSDDPAQTALLQKLDEVRKQDAPARLFQLMQDPRGPPPPPPGRNW